MSKQKNSWYKKWFNEDYLNLYANRDAQEAKHQVKFIIDALNLNGGERILDLGCGAGRHSIAFGEKGYEVLGIDLSSVLIEEAMKSLQQEEALPVKFQVGDMLHLEKVGTFDVIINLFTSFGYFENDTENAKVLRSVRDHFHPGGKFFLDYLHPAQVKRDFVSQSEKEVQGEEVIIQKVLEEDRIVKTISFPDRIYEERVILYTRDQIEQMLDSNHLEVINVWNDYSGNPWKMEGDRQIFYCQAF